jgi:hypothetical protein
MELQICQNIYIFWLQILEPIVEPIIKLGLHHLIYF